MADKLSPEERAARRLASKKRWREANRERLRAYNQGYKDQHGYVENKENAAARNKAWCAKNKERRRAYWRAYYALHRDAMCAWQRKYYAENLEKMRARCRAYRARLCRISNIAPQYEELRRTALLANPFYAVADAALSRSLPPFMRSDVISMIVEAGYRGELKVEDVPTSAKRFISQYYRDYGSAYGVASLDDVVPGTDLKAIDGIVYEGAGVGFDGDDQPDDEDAFFMDELV